MRTIDLNGIVLVCNANPSNILILASGTKVIRDYFYATQIHDVHASKFSNNSIFITPHHHQQQPTHATKDLKQTQLFFFCQSKQNPFTLKQSFSTCHRHHRWRHTVVVRRDVSRKHLYPIHCKCHYGSFDTHTKFFPFLLF